MPAAQGWPLWWAGVACALSCALPSSQTPDNVESGHREEPVLATWRGGELGTAEVEQHAADRLRDLDVRYALERYELVGMALDAALEDVLLEAEREARGLSSVQRLLTIEVDGKSPPPTDEELRTEFVVFQQRMPGATWEEARGYLSRQLREERRQRRHKAFLGELKEQHEVVVALPYPDIPRVWPLLREHDPILGEQDAPVTLVLFAEYQCRYCGELVPQLDRVLEQHQGEVRVVFKDFPLAGHGRARAAAKAAQCAGTQGRYWALGRRLFAAQGHLADEDLRRLAVDAGLDVRAWERCTRDPGWEARINEDAADGRAVGVESTPTLFVNGLMVRGIQSYDRLNSLVDQELRRVARTP